MPILDIKTPNLVKVHLDTEQKTETSNLNTDEQLNWQSIQDIMDI